MAEAIIEGCRDFYDSLSGEAPPPMDGSPATFAVIRRMYADIDRSRTVELDPGLAAAFVAANLDAKDAEAERKRTVGLVREAMGDARMGMCAKVPVARRQGAAGGTSVVCLPKTYLSVEEAS